MTLKDYQNISSKEDLPRINRSYDAFKTVRGTSPYYEAAKKNLMAILRQKGCPTLFLTLSCAEYKWDNLIKEILQVKEKRIVDINEVTNMSSSARNKLLIENPVISTLHFSKRMDKIFRYFQTTDAFKPYRMADYFFRIEFQARGAPHLHSLIYLEEERIDEESGEIEWKPVKSMYQETDNNEQRQEIIDSIERCAEHLICASLSDIQCDDCNSSEDPGSMKNTDCPNCKEIIERVQNFNCGHSCGFSCHKKKRQLTIKEDEGHGYLDKQMAEEEMVHLLCRYGFPKEVMEETTFIPAIPKDIDAKVLEKMKADYKKLRKYMIRQTSTEEKWKVFKEMTYEEFLFKAGFMPEDNDKTQEDRVKMAHSRYLECLAVGLKGNGKIFPKRKCADVYTNNFNINLMKIHEANMDIQLVSDPWCCCEYVTDYITKAEAGRSDVLQSVDDEGKDLTQQGVLNQISQNIDKKREVSIQEGCYRLLGLSMVKSSVRVKFVHTNHPSKRDGLLKGNLSELDPNDSPFHFNIINYYESRPYDDLYSADEHLLDQIQIESWKSMCLADFVSLFDIIYGTKKEKELKPNEFELLDGKGRIKIRNRRAILRYYLKYDNDLENRRGKLILFLPFRNEMSEIHEMDIDELYDYNLSTILENQSKYEFKFQGKTMAQILSEFEENREVEEDEDEDEAELLETTTAEDLESFQKEFDNWKNEGTKGLTGLKQFVDVLNPTEHQNLVAGLNYQQRKLHNDLVERECAIEEEKEAFHVFISGEAGTGKSYLTKVIMESFKQLHVKSGNDLSKPSILCLCPTATAAFIVGGKTIESALQLQGSNYTYKKLSAERETDLKFKYDEVETIFCDEISMIGSGKLAKINYRLQDLSHGKNRKLFMGGRSSIVTGDLFQLPPVKDKYIFMNTPLDDRPKMAPSHWDENYKIAFLTEKMRSQGEIAFGETCDRIARDEITDDDVEFLQTLVRKCPNEEDNEFFKNGDISIIVTTNDKREKINNAKLEELLPNEVAISSTCEDKCTNLLDAPPPPKDINYTSTKGLPSKIQLKVDAPIMITLNDPKFKDDGITNGARGYIDSFQFEEENANQLKAIWVVFKEKTVGQRLRRERRDLRAFHKPNSNDAVPIEVKKTCFEVNQGNLKYVRTQFPMVLGYAITSHKSQGQTMSEVIIDFSSGDRKKGLILYQAHFMWL